MKVKFCFGPFDGHKQSVDDNIELAELVLLPVNRHTLLLVNNIEHIPTADCKRNTSVATYELGENNTYYFVGSVAPHHADEFCQGK